MADETIQKSHEQLSGERNKDGDPNGTPEKTGVGLGDYDGNQDDKEESIVGKKLTDFTTRKVIILVLAMLFSTPFFSVEYYLEQPLSYSYGLH